MSPEPLMWRIIRSGCLLSWSFPDTNTEKQSPPPSSPPPPYLSIWLVYHLVITHPYHHASPCFIQAERGKDEGGEGAVGMRFRKRVGKMVSDSEKGRDGKKGQGQVRDEPKLNPEWIRMKVRPGEKERKRRREWEYIRRKDKVAGRERVSRGWRRERWWKVN